MLKSGSGGFSVGMGQRDLAAPLFHFGKIGAETRYPIASASKFLTAATIMSLVDDGALTLDQPISEWLPALPEHAGGLTLRQLLSQTSGLAGVHGELYDLEQDHRISLNDSAMEVAARPLLTEPGTVFAYGGPGFQVAGAVVEAVTKQSWAEVFRTRIAVPIGMKNTVWTHLRLGTTATPPVAQTLNPVLQGGAVATAGDYLRFLSMIAQDGRFDGTRVLSSAAVDALLKNQTATARMTPTGANVLVDARYALGNWCESWDSSDAGLLNSSIGIFGVYPWIERPTGRFGIVFPCVRENAFRFWPQIETIRDVLLGRSHSRDA